MGRAPCCEKVGLKRGRWTTEEDEILTKYIQANGEGSWRSLPKNAGLLRCGKSCRLRWINYLRSDLKRGNISSEEEEIIINLHASLGNRWSLIAGHLPGRTDNEIKNYWNSHLSKKLHSSKTSENDSLPAAPAPAAPVVMDSAKPEALVKKRKGSRSSRSNMKKNRCSNVPSQSIEEKVPRGPANTTVQMPRTPTLEKETLSSAISWEEENINKAIVDPCPSEERTENMADTSPEDGETKANWMSQSAAKFTSGDLWATCDLCLDDVSMGNGELADPDGILSFHGNKETCEIVASDDQREHGGGKRTTKDMDPGCCRRPSPNDRQDLETDKLEIMEVSNVGNCEWSVSSPAHDGKLYDWDDWQWDIPVEDVQNDLTTLGDKADMLSWLWDSDNNNGKGDCDDDGPSPGADILDDEKHNAMVAWLLS